MPKSWVGISKCVVYDIILYIVYYIAHYINVRISNAILT